MSNSVKAVLLSALVFPGCGHYFLKKNIAGTLLLGISVVCLYFLLVTTVTIAQEISDRILQGEIPMDIVEISQAILIQLADSPIHQLNGATLLLFICWIIGMVDSYRLGRIEDQRNTAKL